MVNSGHQSKEDAHEQLAGAGDECRQNDYRANKRFSHGAHLLSVGKNYYSTHSKYNKWFIRVNWQKSLVPSSIKSDWHLKALPLPSETPSRSEQKTNEGLPPVLKSAV